MTFAHTHTQVTPQIAEWLEGEGGRWKKRRDSQGLNVGLNEIVCACVRLCMLDVYLYFLGAWERHLSPEPSSKGNLIACVCRTRMRTYTEISHAWWWEWGHRTCDDKTLDPTALFCHILNVHLGHLRDGEQILAEGPPTKEGGGDARSRPPCKNYCATLSCL
jgi:hypothetical protein